MAPQIKPSEHYVPMCYAYSTPEIQRHDGWVKLGYTDRQDVAERIKQQSNTIDTIAKEEWRGNAIFEDGSGEIFHDSDFHRYLNKLGVERVPRKEWFHLDGAESYKLFNQFRQNRNFIKTEGVIPYDLRKEQKEAVEKTASYYHTRPKTGEFLWNAKPRFGKTLTAYDLAKTVDAKNVLILTNRPAIANSWYEDYEKFLGTESGYAFVSETGELKNKKHSLSRKDFIMEKHKNPDLKCIEFISLQDLKGSIYGGGKFDKLQEVYNQDWDLIILDESHEGTDTIKSEIAFDRMKPGFKLYLSGTPFKAIANEKFDDKAIFNWTYEDEQEAKRVWENESIAENPYSSLPQLNLFTYQMSEIIKDEISKGIDLDGTTEEYAFDLNEFFKTDKKGNFIHDADVDKFLDAMVIQEKFPFSTQELRDELNHTFWMLDRVDSARALAKKLKAHPIFKDYEIVLAAGDGVIEEDGTGSEKAYDMVKEAIKNHDKTITLSVGKLNTGITIPEWTGVMMLSNVKSPAKYMQTAFRAQTPYIFKKDGKNYRKERAYVFDFDPSRTLLMYEEMANGLSPETSGGTGNSEEHKKKIKKLLNFFPVLAEDKYGKMVELDAEKVLSLPRKIRAEEVVNRGFMSDFLFQNITNVFHAPKEVVEIINSFEETKTPKETSKIDVEAIEELPVNEKGEIEIPQKEVEEKTERIFGDKIYEIQQEAIDKVTTSVKDEKKKSEEQLNDTSKVIHEKVIKPMMDTVRKEYGSKLPAGERKRLEKRLDGKAEREISKVIINHDIEMNTLEAEKNSRIQSSKNENEKEKIIEIYEKKIEEAHNKREEDLKKVVEGFVPKASNEIIQTVETVQKEKQSQDIQSQIRGHLRGFSRTIPSFIMAYGVDDNHNDVYLTLKNFDKVVPPEVFKEVTGITLDQFKLLRDGGNYIDEKTGEKKHFNGNLFDPYVFDAAVREFQSKREKLAGYMKENAKGDIFDYIPPQKTNQIFTPKKVVKMMVDDLEKENPDIFSNPDETFMDMYMKSGQYIAEIIRRLFQNPKMKELYPDDDERLRHILEKQVYGMAPTPIIYKIATNYILGFDWNGKFKKHNLRQADAMKLIEDGKLELELENLYPEMA